MHHRIAKWPVLIALSATLAAAQDGDVVAAAAATAHARSMAEVSQSSDRYLCPNASEQGSGAFAELTRTAWGNGVLEVPSRGWVDFHSRVYQGEAQIAQSVELTSPVSLTCLAVDAYAPNLPVEVIAIGAAPVHGRPPWDVGVQVLGGNSALAQLEGRLLLNEMQGAPLLMNQFPRGTAVVSARIDTNGVARDIQVLRTQGKEVDAKAIELIRQWTFAPVLRDREPVGAYRVLAVAPQVFRSRAHWWSSLTIFVKRILPLGCRIEP